MLRILLIDESPERAATIRTELERERFAVDVIESPMDLLQAIEDTPPDVIIVDTESPVRDVLEHIVMVTRDRPRPIVMFVSDGGPEAIRDAVRAGVSAYVVNGLDPQRVKSIIEVAVARFEEHGRLVERLTEAQRTLSERKVVDQAKALLMKKRGMSEDEAYHFLRRNAMERGRRLAEFARQVLDLGDLIA